MTFEQGLQEGEGVHRVAISGRRVFEQWEWQSHRPSGGKVSGVFRNSKQLAWPRRSTGIVGDELKEGTEGPITYWLVGPCIDVGFPLRQVESVEVT